jgi:hypothetical protein
MSDTTKTPSKASIFTILKLGSGWLDQRFIIYVIYVIYFNLVMYFHK